MAGWVVGTQISLRLDDDARGEALSVLVYENAPEEIYSYLSGVPVVEVPFQNL